MNAHGKSLDNTYLSLDQAEMRGFLHRDYIAHCLRWSHVVKYLYSSKTYLTAKILDIGCGEEVPLLKLLHSSRLGPTQGYYVGIDAKKFDPPTKLVNFESHILPGFVFPTSHTATNTLLPTVNLPHDEFNIITCFEVLEHVEPHGSLDILKGIKELLIKSQGTAFISTPCYDARVGAADNHVNEMSYMALWFMLERAGLSVVNHWGTFASQKDYKNKMTPDELILFEKLSAYYDSNLVACIFAPLFPVHSRNVLWQVVGHDVDNAIKPPTNITREQLTSVDASSSKLWLDFIEGVIK
jgi:hypothetical protein